MTEEAPEDTTEATETTDTTENTEEVTDEKTDPMAAFSDTAAIADWASEAMTWAVNAGILEGTPDAQLLPQGVATRAQVSAMMLRFCRTLLA